MAGVFFFHCLCISLSQIFLFSHYQIIERLYFLDLTIPMRFSRAQNFAQPQKMKNTGLPDMKNCNRFKIFSKFAKQKSEAKNALKYKFDPILIDFSLCFFANHFFKSTATCLILVKNLGNFTNKNAKNISEILVKMETNLILIDFSLVYFANLFFKIAKK